MIDLGPFNVCPILLSSDGFGYDFRHNNEIDWASNGTYSLVTKDMLFITTK